MEEAIEQMAQGQESLAKAPYKAQLNNRESAEMSRILEAAREKLQQASKAIETEISGGGEENIAETARKMAEQLAKDADALDESLTDVEREIMLARLEAAKRLLEQMPEPQWTMVAGRPNRKSVVQSLVLTKSPPSVLAKAARSMAREFFSLAIEAEKKESLLIEQEPSNAKFYKLEVEFFETAAMFDKQGAKK
jgi:hypothetical protein